MRRWNPMQTSYPTPPLSGPRRRRVAARALWVVGLGLSGISNPAQADIMYVDARARGTNHGTRWHDAFRDLQDALAVAQAGDEIWVAEGMYTPDRGTGDRGMSFELKNGVGLYGGFAGRERRREQRDWAGNETVLTGDLTGDDGPRDCAEFSDCCREHDYPSCDDAYCQALVCTAYPDCCDSDSGLSPSWPEWSYPSCALLASQVCCHLGNWNACENSYRVVTATEMDAGAVLDGFTITGSYHHSDRDEMPPTGGRGVYVEGGSPTLRNCVVRRNFGTGLRVTESSRMTLFNCVITDNVGFAMTSSEDSVPTIINSSFIENLWSGLSSGGAPILINCTFLRNGFDTGLVADSPMVINCAFIENARGGIYTYSGHAVVTNSLFAGNAAGAGAGLTVSWGRATVTNSVFLANRTYRLGDRPSGRGGAVASSGRTTLTNCKFIGNLAVMGAAIHHDSGLLTVRNCTVAGNQGLSVPGLAVLSDGRAVLENSIFWNNTGSRSYDTERSQINFFSGGTVTVNHSIIEGWTGRYRGVGSSGADPLFIDADGPDNVPGTQDDNLRLSPGSPCIDAGNNAAVPGSITTDLSGWLRFVDDADTPDTGNGEPPIVDIGAYEFQDGPAVTLDIKPGSCPNLVNPRSKGVVPTAIAGSDWFDVTQIDFDSLELAWAGGVGAGVAPLVRGHGRAGNIEDVTAPFDGDLCECHDAGADGIDDLTLKFSTQEVARTFQLDSSRHGTSVMLTLRGRLLDGTEFRASDCISFPTSAKTAGTSTAIGSRR